VKYFHNKLILIFSPFSCIINKYSLLLQEHRFNLLVDHCYIVTFDECLIIYRGCSTMIFFYFYLQHDLLDKLGYLVSNIIYWYLWVTSLFLLVQQIIKKHSRTCSCSLFFCVNIVSVNVSLRRPMQACAYTSSTREGTSNVRG